MLHPVLLNKARPMIHVTKDQIPTDEILKALRDPDCGAIISYLGTVRSYSEKKHSLGLSFEVDPEVMKQQLEKIRTEVLGKFEIKEIAIVHRAGEFHEIGDDILFIAVSSGHRGPAFEACAYAIDRIKELHDCWKKEQLGDPL